MKQDPVMDVEQVKEAHGDAYYTIYGQTLLQAPSEVELLIRAMGLIPGQQLLDVCCGFGRHAVEFARKRMKVKGVDISDVLLAKAVKTTNTNPTYVQMDARKMPYESEFDAVTIMLNSFGLLDDESNEQILERMVAALVPGGHIAVDLRNPIVLARGDIYPPICNTGGVQVHTTSEYFPDQKRVKATRWFMQDGEKKLYEFVARLYPLPDLTGMLAEHGVSVVSTFGDFSGTPYDAEKSPRLITIGKKI